MGLSEVFVSSISRSLNQFLLLRSNAFSSLSFFILIFSGTCGGILFSNERFVTCVVALWTNPKVTNKTMQHMVVKAEREILRFKNSFKERCMMRTSFLEGVVALRIGDDYPRIIYAV